MRKIIFFFILFNFLFFPKNITFASLESPSDYNVTYTTYQNGLTQVNMDVSLTNQEEDSFFSSYKLQLGFSDIKNLKASDTKGSITPTVIKNQKGSSIELKFNEKIIGEGKKLNFQISFDTNEVAENRGNVWEINIPGVSSKNDFNSFNVSVVYPPSIGKPVYIKPNISDAIAKQTTNRLTFTKNELGTSGISIAFGEYQIYSFDLSYHLKNTNLFPIKTEIAIPPETNYQEIIINDMSPRPNNIRIDEDGNWLAGYSLKPAETKNIRVVGKAKVKLYPTEEKITEEQKKEYTKEKPYWETNNSKIKELASELGNAYAIYQFVVKNLTYDFSRVTSNKKRVGAYQVLENPKSAVCLEFTDLFIALARANGIPAREINGFAYAKNPEERPLTLVKDILHAWPEYYDDTLDTWIMVDPTWGNTTGGVDYFFTLDVDHFAFIRKGINSSYPVPPGGYKLSENDNRKDVIVNLESNFEKITDFKIEPNFPNFTFSGFPIKGKVKIINTGNSVIKDNEINIKTDFLLPKNQKYTLNRILPYGYFEREIYFDKTSFLTNKSDTIKIRLENKIEIANIQVAPFYLSKKILLGGIIFVISIVIISIIIYTSRRILVHKQKEQDSIRGESQKS